MLKTAAFICISAAFAIQGTAGQAVHFDYTDGDCSENSTVVEQCAGAYSTTVQIALFLGDLTVEYDCILVTETLACIETALCHCNFSSDHRQLEQGYKTSSTLLYYYNNLTQCANETYGESIQSEVIGAIDVQEGVNCTVYNRTAGDLALSLAIAQLPSVLAAEDVCEGIQDCYYQYDRNLEVALYKKQWSEYCQVSENLTECLVQAACLCGQSSNDTIVNLVNGERVLHRNTCGRYFNVGVFEIGITCPGASRCESPDPQFQCLSEFDTAVRTSGQSGPAFCRALYDLSNCTEQLACECGFYQEQGYYRSLTLAKYTYTHSLNCTSLTGPFPNHTGLNCGVDDRFTDEEKIISIALADPEFVTAAEAECPGIADCYVVANAKSSEAYHMKDLESICEADAERISCVEQAYCSCGKLTEMEVYNKLYNYRVNQGSLCFGVTDFPPLTRCRGLSTCQRNDPLTVCQGEYAYDLSLADTASTVRESEELKCQAEKNYVSCVEQVGCACGLLDDGTAMVAEVVYNLTTLTLKDYNNAGCAYLTDEITPDEGGIRCEGHTDGDTRRKLVLSYANSDEVAALASQCEAVRGCFKTQDLSKAGALRSRSFHNLCKAQETLIGCVDQAYCQCKLNGTAQAENFVMTEIDAHQELCRGSDGPIDRKPCVRETSTGAAENIRLSLCPQLLLLAVAATVM